MRSSGRRWQHKTGDQEINRCKHGSIFGPFRRRIGQNETTNPFRSLHSFVVFIYENINMRYMYRAVFHAGTFFGFGRKLVGN